MASSKNSNGKAPSGKRATTRQVSASSSTKSKAKPRSKSATTRKSAPKSSGSSFSLNGSQKALLAGMAILFASAVLFLSLLSPDQGSFTVWLSDWMARLFGIGRYAIPVITGLVGLYLVMRGMEQTPQVPVYRVLGFAILFLIFLAFASLIAVRRNPLLGDVWAAADAGQGAGYTGALIASVLTRLLGDLGALLFLVIMGIIGGLLLTGVSRAQMGEAVASVGKPKAAGEAGAAPAPTAERPPLRINPGREPKPATAANPGPTQLPLPDPAAVPKGQPKREAKPAAPAVAAGAAAASAANGRSRAAAPKAKPGAGPAPATVPAAPQVTAAAADGLTWKVPTVDEVLDSGTDLDTNNAAIREQVEIIEHTLESFGAPATVVEINQGPTITQFGVEPNYVVMRGGKRTKVKVGKIASLADDLALALAARSIRIQAPVPGKGYVGIEVPNSAKALVSLRDVMESGEFAKMKSPLKIGLGQNVAGQPIVADLAAMPHVLIAGTTGSGKSVCVNALIACLLLQNTPDDLKLVMVDPKRVELTGYNGVPHLAAPVVVDMDRVIGTLQWALREMDNRYKLFASVGARNIQDYNKKLGRRSGEQKLPNVVIIVDELADLMMLAPEDTERSITRLAQMARATGIHMVIATQRPSVDVVTGLIKANFPARIAFAVASSTDSRVILDTTGAERLLGQGDMLFQSPDAAAPVRLQGCFVSDSELQKLIHYWQTARRFQTIPAPDPNAIPAATAGAAATAAPAGTAPAGTAPAAAAAPMATLPRPVAEPDDGDQPARPKSTQAGRPAVPPPTVHLGGSEAVGEEVAEEAAAVEETEDEDLFAPEPTRNTSTAVSNAGVTQQPLWEALQQMEADAANAAEYDDELMPEAIALVRKLNKASTSLLQRRFRIGYTRAARMMDALEEQGIIGPPTGTSKAREVYAEDGRALPSEEEQE
jgi:S-DNA-T family DNA segregation ATPase FtsK/SpoIIIE